MTPKTGAILHPFYADTYPHSCSLFSAESLADQPLAGVSNVDSPVVDQPFGLALGSRSCGVYVPRPSISGITPNSTTAGGINFLLRVDGYDSRRDSVVSWNGSSRVTGFVNSHRLLAAITAADTAQPGTVLVFVFNPPEINTTSVSAAIGVKTVTVCSGKDSNAVSFTINT